MLDCKKPQKIQEIFFNISTKFQSNGIPSNNLESEVIIRHALGIDRASFFASLDKNIDQVKLLEIEDLTLRRLNNEPLFYIIGKREFYGLEFKVTKDTLIPRQETELLVEVAIKQVEKWKNKKINIADIGTGSGAIAIALGKNIKNALISATDSQSDAIIIAKDNAANHHLSKRINFLVGDLFSPLTHQMDLIVANPPYIPTSEINHLSPEVKREPIHALDGGFNGLLLIERILSEHHPYLKKSGSLIIEFGNNQKEEVISLAEKWSTHKRISTFNDYSGIPRAVLIHP